MLKDSHGVGSMRAVLVEFPILPLIVLRQRNHPNGIMETEEDLLVMVPLGLTGFPDGI